MKPEVFFLRYAFPCAHILLETGFINNERYGELERCAKEGIILPRKKLEESFPAAFRRIKNLAREMGTDDYWGIDVMRKYWYEDHNKIIDAGDGNYSKFPNSFHDFCKVHIANILEVLPHGALVIEYDDNRRPVLGEYVLGAKVGNRVRIHQAYAVEKVEE